MLESEYTDSSTKENKKYSQDGVFFAGSTTLRPNQFLNKNLQAKLTYLVTAKFIRDLLGLQIWESPRRRQENHPRKCQMQFQVKLQLGLEIQTQLH